VKVALRDCLIRGEWGLQLNTVIPIRPQEESPRLVYVQRTALAAGPWAGPNLPADILVPGTRLESGWNGVEFQHACSKARIPRG
jgi:hypothetical protein